MEKTKKTAKNQAGAKDGGICPIRDLLTRLGDKWSILVMVALAKADGNCLRFSEILRSVTGISQRMLTTTLRTLERDGMVTRKLYPEVPPRTEYALTALGKGLLVPVKSLVKWIEGQWPEIERSREQYDNRKSANK